MEVQELKKVNIGFGIIDCSSLQLDSLMLPARSYIYVCLVFWIRIILVGRVKYLFQGVHFGLS